MEFDRVIEEIGEELKGQNVDSSHVLGWLEHIVIVPFLLRAGMRDKWIMDFFEERLSTIYDFTVKNKYNIYIDTEGYNNIPKSFEGRHIIREELYENGVICFPLEYDLYAFAAVYKEIADDLRRKIDNVVEYVHDQQFLKIEDGYGVLHKNKRYWAMGWDPKPTNLCKYYKYNPILLKIHLFGHFSSVIANEWFIQAIAKMNEYVDSCGIYHFPSEFLTEKDSCWILGNHMGLGENRRKKKSMEIEGTFRALSILKRIEENDDKEL